MRIYPPKMNRMTGYQYETEKEKREKKGFKMTVSQTNMAVDYSLTLPFRLVTKDSVIIELVCVNLITKIVSKVQ